MIFLNKYNFDAGRSDLFTGYLKKTINVFQHIFQGHSSRINGRCVVAALRGYVTQRRHNTAAVDLVTVALGNVTENIFCFFKYPVNKFEICKDLFKDPVNI